MFGFFATVLLCVSVLLFFPGDAGVNATREPSARLRRPYGVSEQIRGLYKYFRHVSKYSRAECVRRLNDAKVTNEEVTEAQLKYIDRMGSRTPIRPGRPARTLGPDELDILIRLALDYPDLTKDPTQDELADAFFLQTGEYLSRQRVSKILEKHVLVLPACPRPPLTWLDRRTREAFARMVFAGPDEYDRIAFSDEKYFHLSCWTKSRRVYCLNRNDFRRYRQKHPHAPAVMVWGLVSVTGGLCLLKFSPGEMMNSSLYASVIYEHVIGMRADRPDLFFQQDGAGAHTGPEALAAIRLLQTLSFWPPYSPDWSPIELVWAAMAQIVRSRNPQTVDEMVKEIEAAWKQETTPEKLRGYWDHCLRNIARSAEVDFGNEYKD